MSFDLVFLLILMGVFFENFLYLYIKNNFSLNLSKVILILIDLIFAVYLGFLLQKTSNDNPVIFLYMGAIVYFCLSWAYKKERLHRQHDIL
jgi:hypothetical protein